MHTFFPLSTPQRRPVKGLWALGIVLGLAALISPVLAPQTAEAFCGFYVSGASDNLYNNATQVVMMREGTRTVLSMQNNYEGPPENFAMVVPVPVVLQEENVKTLENSLFQDVNRMAAPRLVEYWEQDPCNPHPPVPDMVMSAPGNMVDEMVEDDAGNEEELVTIEAQFKVGEYDIVVLSAKESNALDTWLRQNNYNIPKGAEPVLRSYVEQGLYFFVAKVDVEKVKFQEGRAQLSPLRFHYDQEKFTLPIRLGLLNAKGAQDLIVHILAQKKRYQVVGRPNITIPTNIGVSPEAKKRFGEFYAALFDRTTAQNPGAVITEYSWDASGCDPCPGPNLTGEHFWTLGAEALPSQQQWGYVLTRLHMRYTKDELKDDLVFAVADPIVGGREVHGPKGELEQGSQPAGQNNFQGRYIIRHPWTGPIECQNPNRGVWGGPPNDPWGQNIPQAAQDTAFAPRGQIQLASFVEAPIPEIDLTATELKNVKNTEPQPPGTKVGTGPGGGGCASCTTLNTPTQTGGWLAASLLGLLLVRRRLRR